jgi:hypothetical protein
MIKLLRSNVDRRYDHCKLLPISRARAHGPDRLTIGVCGSAFMRYRFGIPTAGGTRFWESP